ncbi:MAG: bifunctional UDP-N-acetylmuramoyl-tripeptide:D-alanyl-D-alanine ligase/alanine racemase [Flavobacteriales bacterium]
MEGYTIHAIADAAGGTLTIGNAQEHVGQLVIDTRNALPEHALFIALRGKHHDGHRWIAGLAERGVPHVIAAADATFDAQGLNVIRVPDTLVALQRLAAWHRSHFSYPVIGITGSNGKTVVKEWLFQLLREEHIVRSPGSWNSQVGVPLSVWNMTNAHTLGVFEAGISEPGEMARLEPIIAPTIGVFTNLGPAHGEHFPQGDAQKAREKALLFKHARRVVYCADHFAVREALDAALPSAVERCAWSRSGPAFVQVTGERTDQRGTELGLLHRGTAFHCTVPFTDGASIENALHAITVLLCLGHGPAWIAERVQRLEPVAMRLQLVDGLAGSTLINDTYSNDLASLTIALQQLVRTGAGRTRAVVLSDILDSGGDPATRYARVADLLRQAGIDSLIGIGPEIGAHLSTFPNARFFPDAPAALEALGTAPFAETVVLVKGARAFGLERLVEAWEERTHGTVLEIDLDAVRHNLNHYRVQCGPDVRIMAMVKASGYGSGAVELSRLFAHERVAYLGVAYADEGIELRRHGIRTPVLVMNPEPVPLGVLHRFDLGAVVYDRASLERALAFAQHERTEPTVHLKLDTGMHRLGFLPEEVPAVCERLRGAPLRVASIFSHLAASEDPAQDGFTRRQIALFNDGTERLIAALGHRPLLHLANTAGAARFPEARFDLVRLGIGLHGVGADAQETARLLPTATLRTVIAQVKDIPVGDTIGYGRTYRCERPTRIAVLPIGYADGLSRRLSNGAGRVWIGGRPAPFIGTICMDMCMVDITGIPCAVGEAAIVFSPAHPVQEFARDLGTIPYEALTAISPRVKRIYLHG